MSKLFSPIFAICRPPTKRDTSIAKLLSRTQKSSASFLDYCSPWLGFENVSAAHISKITEAGGAYSESLLQEICNVSSFRFIHSSLPAADIWGSLPHYTCSLLLFFCFTALFFPKRGKKSYEICSVPRLKGASIVLDY